MGKYGKQRLFEMMGKVDPTFKPRLNEGDAFNDAGEPLMTHQQYNAYSEPSEPDYDNPSGDYEREPSSYEIVEEIQNHFDTILETYDGEEYSFLTKDVPNSDINGDLMLYVQNNKISAYALGKEFPETDIEELAIDDLFQFFEPYRQYILTGQDAAKRMDYINKQNSDDARYASQERAAMGGGE